MISVTRLDGTPMIVNTDQIAWVEYIPDTVISLMNGEKLIVRESPEQIVDRIKEFRRALLLPSPRGPAAGAKLVPGISVVESSIAGGPS